MCYYFVINMKKKNSNNYLLKDWVIVAVSIIVAVFLAQSGVLGNFLTSTNRVVFLGSFIAGMFFTSIFTVPIAMVALAEIAKTHEIFFVAILGGVGAVVGDLIIFRFIRDRLSEHLSLILSHLGVGKRIKAFLSLKYFRWLTFLVGGLIIASPLPDEVGISLLGFSKISTWGFILLSFVFNSIGILVVVAIANAI